MPPPTSQAALNTFTTTLDVAIGGEREEKLSTTADPVRRFSITASGDDPPKSLPGSGPMNYADFLGMGKEAEFPKRTELTDPLSLSEETQAKDMNKNNVLKPRWHLHRGGVKVAVGGNFVNQTEAAVDEWDDLVGTRSIPLDACFRGEGNMLLKSDQKGVSDDSQGNEEGSDDSWGQRRHRRRRRRNRKHKAIAQKPGRKGKKA